MTRPTVRRVTAAVLTATSAILLVSVQTAAAKYRGTDVLGNLSPESLLGDGSLVDRYPLSAYSLDYHVDVGISELSGVPPTIAQWASAQLWSITSFLVRAVIDLFTWAFSLDLLGGSDPHTGDGAIGPVAGAVSSLYENVIGEAWLATALVLTGLWGIHNGLVRRRYSHTAASLAVSVCFVIVALFFVYQPERTIGQASQWANQLSLAFLSGANRGTVDDPVTAKRDVADQLFSAQIVQPWLALNFGGARHCVDTNRLDDDGFPTPVSIHDPARDVCRDHLRAGRDGHGGYAPRFLRHAAGSDERDAEYNALKTGEAPSDDPQFKDYAVDKADAPAVDIQQAGGAYQRLTLAVVIFVGSLGMVFLLGFLALAIVLAQIIALVLLAFAPVALIVGVFPGAGHDLFRAWLTRLGTAVFIKAVYSLVIAVVVAVSAALGQAAEGLGFLMAFGLQAVFFWAVFVYRKQISARLVGATAGRYDAGPVRTAAQKGADLAARPFQVLTALPGRASGSASARQESALVGAAGPRPAGQNRDGSTAEQRFGREQPAELTPAEHEAERPTVHAAATYPPALGQANGNGHAPDRLRPPGSNGRAPARPERNGAHGTHQAPGMDRDSTGPGANAERAPWPSPSADVMRQARELREAQDDQARKPPETER